MSVLFEGLKEGGGPQSVVFVGKNNPLMAFGKLDVGYNSLQMGRTNLLFKYL